MNMLVKERLAARADGDTYFYTGRKCRRGHLERRYVSSGTCLGCEKLRDKARYEDEKEYRRGKAAEWVRANPKRKKDTDAAYERKNRVKLNAARRQKYAEDTGYRMSVSIRTMLRNTYHAFSKTKRSKTYELVGYEPEDLIRHLADRFTEGMNWDNYGEWQIDHIKPIDAFVREGNFNVKEINALDNLQPLWASDNASKGSRYDG